MQDREVFYFCLENIGLVYADVTMFTSKHMNIKHFVLRLSSLGLTLLSCTQARLE